MTRRPPIRTDHQLVTHFWMLVQISTPDQCWLWQGYQEKGYGKYFVAPRMRFAHDLALEWYSGEPRPEGMDTCHSCNVPLCVNPAHLRYDTRRSNVADTLAAGQHICQNQRKITDLDVVAIRYRADAGATGKRIAQDFGLSESMVTEIIRGNRYPRLAGPIRTTHGNRKKPNHAG